VVDYKVEEFDLIRVKSAAAQEFSEGTFSGLSVSRPMSAGLPWLQ
jgi:hypothetical protein